MVIRERRRGRTQATMRSDGVCRANGEILVSGPVFPRDRRKESMHVKIVFQEM